MVQLKVCEFAWHDFACALQINRFFTFFPHHVIAESDLHEQEIQVTFPAGKTTVDASIGINDDEIAESLEIFHLVLEIPDKATGNGVVAIAPNTTEIKIIDNDSKKWLMV